MEPQEAAALSQIATPSTPAPLPTIAIFEQSSDEIIGEIIMPSYSSSNRVPQTSMYHEHSAFAGEQLEIGAVAVVQHIDRQEAVENEVAKTH